MSNEPTTGKHRGGRGQPVWVAELVARQVQDCQPLRLNWRPDDLDKSGMVVAAHHDDTPTGELPRITSDMLRKTGT
ncbi:hypothetical protein Acsp05_38160 [Actinokineospora sp. NBRC 105648]|nr:hypothetical protein Acsp05_38160 [Actinokineospora sp. NBRC 105648]